MNFTNKFTSLLFAAFALIIIFSSCQKEEQIEKQPIQKPTTSTELLPLQKEVPSQDLKKLEQLLFNNEDVFLTEFSTPDGKKEEAYLIEGDILISKEQLDNMHVCGLPDETERQYRTCSLVSSPRTIRVIGWTGGGGYGLTSKMRTALQWAVNNYNALNMGLTFTLSYAASTNADIVVYRQPNNSGAGGVAGFPSGGNPYKWVQLFSGMDAYDTNTNEHVITHEIGHCLGLRHTDWFSRESCGGFAPETPVNPCAIWIPGTPTGFDPNSVMLACFGSNENGEFGYYDRVALEYLY